jgi:hypothetical protein
MGGKYQGPPEDIPLGSAPAKLSGSLTLSVHLCAIVLVGAALYFGRDLFCRLC